MDELGVGVGGACDHHRTHLPKQVVHRTCLFVAPLGGEFRRPLSIDIGDHDPVDRGKRGKSGGVERSDAAHPDHAYVHGVPRLQPGLERSNERRYHRVPRLDAVKGSRACYRSEEVVDGDRAANHSPGHRPLPDCPADGGWERRSSAVRRRLRHLRPRERHLPGRGAGEGERPAPDMARAERADHGDGRGGFRQGASTASDHGGHVVDRARCRQHGDGGRHRHGQQTPAVAPLGRHVRQPASRPCAPTGGAFRRPDPDRQRRLQGGLPLSGTASPIRRRSSTACPGPSPPCSTPAGAVPPFWGWPKTSRPRPSTIPWSSSPRRVHRFGDPAPTHPSWRRRQPCSGGPPARW